MDAVQHNEKALLYVQEIGTLTVKKHMKVQEVHWIPICLSWYWKETVLYCKNKSYHLHEENIIF